MVRAPFAVGTVSTVRYFPPTSLTMLRVPLPPFELKASPRVESNPAASGPLPMAGVATTLNVGMSVTAITLSHTEKSFLPLTSMARPLGPSHGSTEVRRVTALVAASISTTSLELSMLT